MSNRACLQPCKYVDIGANGETSEPTYGFRLYDNYAHTYINFFGESEFKQTLAELRKAKNVFKVMRRMFNHSEVAESILETAEKETGGIYIGDNWCVT